jgi:hypothetical protein
VDAGAGGGVGVGTPVVVTLRVVVSPAGAAGDVWYGSLGRWTRYVGTSVRTSPPSDGAAKA